MKKSVVTLLLVLAASLAFAQAAPAPTAPTGQAAPAGQAAPQQKTIKDPAEYNAYVTAVNQTTPEAKAQAFEAFLQQYPNTVMKEEALSALMGVYQQSGNLQKVAEAANRLLQVSPHNVRALFVLAYLHRSQAEAGQNPQQESAQAQEFGQRGLEALQTWTKPEEMAAAEFEQQKQQMTIIFNGAVGFGALQKKDYATAAKFLQAAVDAGPTSPINNGNIYPLAIAYLEQQPINPTGLWYMAKAAALTNNNPQVVKYGRSKYVKYHGSPDGWEQLLAQAKSSPGVQPPAGWTVAPAPTPAELAAKIAQSKKVNDMSFDEIQLVLTAGAPPAAEQVWSQLKDKAIKLEGKLIGGDPKKLMIAASADDIEANKADMELVMAEPIPAKIMPKDGSTIQFQGTFATYDANPFMVHMKDGILLDKTGKAMTVPKATAPAKRSPAKKRPPR